MLPGQPVLAALTRYVDPSGGATFDRADGPIQISHQAFGVNDINGCSAWGAATTPPLRCSTACQPSSCQPHLDRDRLPPTDAASPSGLDECVHFCLPPLPTSHPRQAPLSAAHLLPPSAHRSAAAFHPHIQAVYPPSADPINEPLGVREKRWNASQHVHPSQPTAAHGTQHTMMPDANPPLRFPSRSRQFSRSEAPMSTYGTDLPSTKQQSLLQWTLLHGQQHRTQHAQRHLHHQFVNRRSQCLSSATTPQPFGCGWAGQCHQHPFSGQQLSPLQAFQNILDQDIPSYALSDASLFRRDHSSTAGPAQLSDCHAQQRGGFQDACMHSAHATSNPSAFYSSQLSTQARAHVALPHMRVLPQPRAQQTASWGPQVKYFQFDAMLAQVEHLHACEAQVAVAPNPTAWPMSSCGGKRKAADAVLDTLDTAPLAPAKQPRRAASGPHEADFIAHACTPHKLLTRALPRDSSPRCAARIMRCTHALRSVRSRCDDPQSDSPPRGAKWHPSEGWYAQQLQELTGLLDDDSGANVPCALPAPPEWDAQSCAGDSGAVCGGSRVRRRIAAQWQPYRAAGAAFGGNVAGVAIEGMGES